MEKIRKLVNKMFREDLQIQHKLLNLILLAAFFGGNISIVVSIVIGSHMSSILSITVIIIVVIAALWIANKKNRPRDGALLIVILANMVIFPIMYFTSGGMHSGMPVWFVLGLIFSWLLLSGPICVIMYILNVIAVAVCILVEMKHPELVIPLNSIEAEHLDVIQSVIVVTCIFGAIFKYQTYVYEKQKNEILEANRAKSEFLKNMSHEIRTPINAIIGYNEMVVKESKESQTVSYAMKIQTAGVRLLSLVNEIFNFTSLDGKEFSIEQFAIENDIMLENEMVEEPEEFEASKARVLIIDDNEMNRDLLLGMLKDTKMQMDVGVNGEEAVALLRKNHYDLVLMDHMMPVMDGIEALKLIKEEHICDNTPIIVLTAHAVGNVKEEYLQAGFDDYLSKPIIYKQLLTLIQKYLPITLMDKEEESSVSNDNPFYFLDTKMGMEYCCNNEEFYREMLSSYLANNKSVDIRKSYEQEDWEQYRILVHALKSTSLSIGAVTVSERAKELEFAAKENRIEDIKMQHDSMFALYQELLQQLEDALNGKAETETDNQQEIETDNEHILVVDDDAMNLKIAEKMLEGLFTVTCVQSGMEALEFLKNHVPNLILLDLHMPQMDGFEVNRQIKNTDGLKEIPVVFLTADHDRETEIKGFGEGALDFITKPFVADIMLQRIRRILELDRLQKNLQLEVEKQTRTAEARREKVERLSMQIMLTLANTIDAKDKYTNGHSIRVAEYAREIARRAGKSIQEQEDIYFVGLLHDIGKIGIPNTIINKTTRLTDEEYAIIKSHPLIGAEILENMTEIPGLSVGAHWHHELFDGSGYPEGLKGNEIPETARIIGVADAYDAMASKRSYRDIMPQEVIMEELKKGRGSQFDPKFTDIMLKMMEQDVEYQMHE